MPYCQIAERFNKTRSKLWKCTKNWYKLIQDATANIDTQEMFILDAGCGNGRNMIEPYIYVGMDTSIALLDKVTYPKAHTVCASVSDLPFPDEYFDHTLCVSVIHHVICSEERLRSIHELIRVTKKGGYICISVWCPPPYVPHLQTMGEDKIIHQVYAGTDVLRHFYIFDKDELNNICQNISSVKVIEYGVHKQSNYIYLLKCSQ